jgi:hypothetical protein
VVSGDRNSCDTVANKSDFAASSAFRSPTRRFSAS